MIALVITIVVLIILAAVAINLSLGNNGIFNRAKTAKEQYQNAQDYEQEKITKISNQIDGYLIGRAGTSRYTIEKIDEKTGTNSITYDASKYDELYIEVQDSVAHTHQFNIKTIALSNSEKQYVNPASYDGKGLWCCISISNSSIKILNERQDNTDVTSSSSIVAYGIKY